MTWVRVATIADLDPTQGHAVTAGQQELALFYVDGTWRAIDDSCPHAGAALSRGRLHDKQVICPVHGWAFDTETGACDIDPASPIGCWPVRETDGFLEVDTAD